jgi:putative nucleotidyltransferase with HDIG domain
MKHSHTSSPFPHCPAPPDWALDWQALVQRFGWLRALDGVPQNPVYHTEGDVLTHTRLVAEALVSREEWRNLPEHTRSLLFAAALLHDVGKPATTRTELDGRITSKKHAQVGAQMARTLLYTGDSLDAPAPFAERETIVQLVRHHGLPVWALERPDPQREVIAASQRVRLDWLALLAEADVRGRIATDRDDLLTNIALFRELCREQDCSDAPYAFANDHSRVQYFRTPGRDAAYAAYDDTSFEVVLLSGLPGAGKDSWLAAHLPDWPVIALDDLRATLDVDPADDQGAVVQAARERARELLRQRQPFAWNATNITRSLRRQLVDLFLSYGARVRIVYVEAPYADLLTRNRRRADAAAVPEKIIQRLLRRLDVPDATEAHAVGWVVEEKDMV